MYEFIKGRVDYIGPEFVVIENNGIGYQISTPNPFSFSKDLGQEAKVFTYHHVRQDVIALYGFHSREEKTLFIKLLDVTGIGPKGALAILASGEPEQVVQAIENEDEAFLVKFPGVGKKTARQMILDLKGKLQNIVPDFFPDLFSQEKLHTAMNEHFPEFDEAILALKALGYSEKEINKISPELKKEKLTTDQYIKMALQRLLK
ncbi:Holliday junction branch migration protein RuvA [Bacillus sp. DTU_2020_1000418_1_SI_GHA_SEK_038]|uniref:Holliday junction branch migration protein RuvA n=1 Tax=Bacillus sp. DTU_2020_1000418_1_SI_GHA_SEK_038 TaxID=3077585 RepID=UPI0028EF9B8D|nr:Holliday junction branch migration protein RuvA [Bacillus sp. DTU_2020_1000418_1_SI_GHA_SEK_038]WNS74433.1 Holliday junction branch migration protein RuvA [Bacillus sp. DTU_2020_1000418_1_SI_GHA_SEK_038]